MNLPFFFVTELTDQRIVLDEDTSKHMISVLRMKNGDEILLTDGKGKKSRAIIIDDNRKRCQVEISNTEQHEQQRAKFAIGISLIKNASRFEWFLEKATELGVSEIIPLICERTEKEKFRHDRLHQILISAMLQSQQTWLPVLHEPLAFKKVIELSFKEKFIAHCLPGEKKSLAIINSIASPTLITHQPIAIGSSPDGYRVILIGPEGDFTPSEIDLALRNNFQPVTLGNTRLRTETAGIAAAVMLGLKFNV